MIILNLIYNSGEDNTKRFKELEDSLNKENISIIRDKKYENILNIISDKDSEITKEYGFSCVSSYLYKLILDKYLREKMDNFLRTTYFFLKESEIEEIKILISDFLLNKNKSKSEYKIDINDKIELMLSLINNDINTENELNIGGFLTFRAKNFFTIIEKIIDRFVEEYMLTKEYVEFIKLMKHFVDIQECRIQEIEINRIDDKYIVTDSYGNNVEEDISSFINSQEINEEDLIMSMLISNAPKIIKVHNKEKFENKDFLELIEQIFEGKINYIKD